METNFEYLLLRLLTHNGEFFGKASPIIQSKYFKEIGNSELYKLIKEYYGQYKAIPSLAELVTKVKNVPNSEIRNEIISSLQKISKTDQISNIQFMLDETVSWVKDSLYYEALQVGSDGLMKRNDELKLKAQKIMDERSKVSIDSDLGLDFDDLDEMIRYYSEKNFGILTQHKELNRRLGSGFLPGTLSLVLSASGVGKSLLMSDLISGMIKLNKKILLVSLEMSSQEIMKRVHANALDLPINSFLELSRDNNGETKELILTSYQKAKLNGVNGKLFVKDYAPGSFSPLMLEQLVESFKIERDITFDIVFVDYLGIMKSDLVSHNVGLYSYIKSIAEEVRASAKKLNLPIISASQLNRSSVNNTDNADNSNVSDSLGTVMTADFLMFLLQNEEMKAKKEVLCKVTKNRFTGRTDTWTMSIDYEKMRFSDCLVQNEDFLDPEIVTESASKVSNKLKDDFGDIF